jgi:hypothetical protein
LKEGDILMSEDPIEPDVDWGRRNFWRQLLGLGGMVAEELRGVPHIRLGDLRELPDSVLAEMIPVWRAGLGPDVCPDGLYCLSAAGESTCEHVFGAHEKLMVDQYAGGRNLQTIAEHVARQSGMTSEAAFQATKALFLDFCRQGLCHPAAAHEQAKSKGGEP